MFASDSQTPFVTAILLHAFSQIYLILYIETCNRGICPELYLFFFNYKGESLHGAFLNCDGDLRKLKFA